MTPSVPRARDGRPYVVPPGGGRPVLYQRASRHASTLDDGYGLDLWHQHLIARALADAPGMLSRVRETYRPGTERGYDWNALNGVCGALRHMAGGDDRADYGTLVHGLTERLDTGRPLDGLTEETVPDLLAYEYRTERMQHLQVERFMVCDQLRVAGTPDRVTYVEEILPTGEMFAGNVIADVKTGRVAGQDVKFAIQLATYANSDLYACTHPVIGSPSKAQCEANADAHTRESAGVNRKWGIIISLPAGQGRCDLYWVDLEIGWTLAQSAQMIRESRKTKTLTPFFLD